MQRNAHINRLLVLGSLTTIVMMLWIGGLVYRALTSDTVTPQVEDVIQPLDPNLDTKILEKIEGRRYIEIEFPDLDTNLN